MDRHGGEPVAIGAQEIMERAQRGADRVDLPILADRRLKIIADHRAVIIAARPLRFFQAPAVRKRVRTAMKHIIAQQVDARSDLRGDGAGDGDVERWVGRGPNAVEAEREEGGVAPRAVTIAGNRFVRFVEQASMALPFSIQPAAVPELTVAIVLVDEATESSMRTPPCSGR